MSQSITIKIQYPENADLEHMARMEEEFAQYMESVGCVVEFSDEDGSLPRPRRPKKVE